MFIKRAKSRPSLRARDSDIEPAPSPLGQSTVTAETSTAQDEEEESAVVNVMERKKAQKAKRDKRLVGVQSSSGPRLSFGSDAGDEDGDSSTPKRNNIGKSSLSRNLNLPSTPSTSPSLGGSNYSREYLDQLKAATPTRLADAYGAEKANGGLSELAQQKYAAQFAEDKTAGIPDAAAVQAAKMKRQAALESAKHGGGDMNEDYIALGGGKLIIRDGQSGPHPESRLMREEDEGDEGDEDLSAYTESSNRLYIGKKANKDAARRLRGEIGEMIADREAEEEESDEETREWELAQASRAGGRYNDAAEVKQQTSYTPATIPRARPPPSLAPVQARILASLQDLNLAKSTGEHDLEVVSGELVSLDQQEQDVRRDVERAAGKKEWVEEFRGWVETLGGFLEEKIPLLEKIEKDFVAHLQERADLVTQRRTADDNDDIALILGVPPQPPTEGDNGDAEEEIDELGRSRRTEYEAGPSSGVRKARRSDRTVRRTRRRARIQTSNGATPTGPGGDDEGFSTDSSLAEGDARDYVEAQRDLGRRVEGLLDDVKAEDFRDPAKGLAVKFGDWRKRYEEEYMGAFGFLSLVQAWAFWARGEMVGWEPLRSNSAIEEFTWFQSLHEYSHPRPTGTNGEVDMEEDDDPPLGPEGDLNGQMVNDAVVPFLIQAFKHGAYDPYSAKQTRKAVDVLEVVQEMAGRDSRKFTDLLRAVLDVFSSHVSSLSTTISATQHADATPPPAFDPATRTTTLRFIRRRIKLLRNILLWRRQAHNEVRALIERILGEVLVPVMSKAWDSGAKEMAGQVLMASGGLSSPQINQFLQRGPLAR